MNTPIFLKQVILHLSAYEYGTECSETSAYKIQTPGNYPEESIQHSEQGESLKSSRLKMFEISFVGIILCLRMSSKTHTRRPTPARYWSSFFSHFSKYLSWPSYICRMIQIQR
jgi:hypothetical protein